MAEITDFFGKASIDTDYAQATTVKTARTPGETVLAAFDLSKFSPDTPVFFVTYQKEVDPTTNEVTIVNQTSWKAIVNPDINTLTNLELAPGYTDIGNEAGDYVECIPTSFWGNQLIEGLFVSLNPDGTIKMEAIAAALGTKGVLGDEIYYTTVGTSTWTKPAGLKFVIVEVQAGGGAGGGSGNTGSSSSSSGGGGGGGAYARKKILASDLADTETVTVGSGGAGGTGSNSDGEASSFGVHASANGGNAGAYRNSNTGGQSARGGSGGSGGVGDVVFSGSGGAASSHNADTRGVGGAGGGSYLGGGGFGAENGASSGTIDGADGLRYGGGGSGAWTSASAAAGNGGSGAQGIVIVHEYF